MASTSTINSWLEELALSIAPKNTKSTQRHKARRSIDVFRRNVRNHPYARTNHFDVEERLTGLEEKFQVLNRDDLSDALHDGRLELREHHHRWLPDILDLLLRLSGNPLGATKSTDFQLIESSGTDSILLEDTGSLQDAEIDSRDPIWALPVFSDLSSEEDEVDTSSVTTSPASNKQKSEKNQPDVLPNKLHLFNEKLTLNDAIFPLSQLSRALPKSNDTYSELQLIRESLLMLQGYPTNTYVWNQDGLCLDPHISLYGIEHEVVQQLTDRLVVIRKQVDVIRAWLRQDMKSQCVQVIQQECSCSVTLYMSRVSDFTKALLHPVSRTPVSLLRTVDFAEQQSRRLLQLAGYVRKAQGKDAMSCLDLLHEMIAYHQVQADIDLDARNLATTFVRAIDLYMKPIRVWLTHGELDPSLPDIFIKHKPGNMDKNTLWHNWYELSLAGNDRPPAFLTHVTQEIFACGKTAAFSRLISGNQITNPTQNLQLDAMIPQLHELASDTAIPFSAGLSDFLRSTFSMILSGKTAMLKTLLDTTCNLEQTLDAFDYVYFGKDGTILDGFETKIFECIDRCMPSWNDRFLIADAYQEGYSMIRCMDVAAIQVHAVHNSSRSMESRRQSVKILGALAVEYILPWPLANMISKSSMTAYRRIALHLQQIRRAKYMLGRKAYIHLQQRPISDDPHDQKIAQGINFMLLQFVNSLYDHFTSGVITPTTEQMRKIFRQASSVDEMITTHKTYMEKLEFACLTAKQLKIVKDTLINLLDLCIRFTDLITSSQQRTRKGSDDIEASSFISAQSQHRRNRRRKREFNHHDDNNYNSSTDEDEDDEETNNGEGYSTFIVLAEDTTVIDEIRNIRKQFARQLEFFVAGLRGAGRGVGESIEDFEVLAGRLEWKPTKKVYEY